MRTLQRILVGHDLQLGGSLAVRSAIDLAQRCNAHVKIVHVVEPYPLYQRLSHPLTSPYNPQELAQRAGEALQKIVNDHKSPSLPLEYEVHTGKPFVELIVARRAWQADLLMVGSRTDGQDRWLGSTGERVIRKARSPVLVVKRSLSATPKTILVPTDFSEHAKKAALEAIAFVRHFGGRLVLLHVLELPSAAAVGYGPTMGALPPMPFLSPQEIEPEWQAFFAELGSFDDVDCTHSTVEGRPVSVIVETAEKQEADLIVMGTHGRTGLQHMLLGSVAEGAVRRSPCSILVIPPDSWQFALP
ncbi:MAG: universal stress protein [Candidatus Binatia bacterium]